MSIREQGVAVTTGVDVATVEEGVGSDVIADTFAGRVHVRWDQQAAVTPLGQLAFFVDFLKQSGLFDRWVSDSPLRFTSPNAPSKRDVLGTALLGVLSGCRRYAHITALRGDAVTPALLGMKKVVSEDAVRRAMKTLDGEAGAAWMRRHLQDCVRPLMSESWILDVDTTVKPLYGHQEGAEIGYNPRKHGRPSHSLHTYVMANVRLILDVEVRSGKQSGSRHSQAGLWRLLGSIDRANWPYMVRGDIDWGNEPVMQRCEQEGLAYLFRLRRTALVKRALHRELMKDGWQSVGHGWEGKETKLQLTGWARARRIILLRRRLQKTAAVPAPGGAVPKQLSLDLVELRDGAEDWEMGALVTSLTDEVTSFGQLYRDRGDCENSYDELKNQWGWGGFTTHDLARCELMARIVALAYNWWSLFARLADPDRHQEAITSRPLLMHAIGRRTEHAGRTTLTVTSTHGEHKKAEAAYRRIARFFAGLRLTAEQLSPVERWYRILSQVMKKYLGGRLLRAPPLLPAA